MGTIISINFKFFQYANFILWCPKENRGEEAMTCGDYLENANQSTDR